MQNGGRRVLAGKGSPVLACLADYTARENDGHARDPAPLVARSHPVPDLRQVLAGHQR